MDNLFTNVDRVIRYIASGFFALLAVYLTDAGCLEKVNTALGANGTWWPMLFTAAVIGLLLYAFNATCMRWNFRLLLLCDGFGAYEPPECGKAASSETRWHSFRRRWKRSKYQFWWYSNQRWLRRVSKEPKVVAVQAELDRWSSLVHFLTCSALALALTPLVMLPHSPFSWTSFAYGMGLYGIAAVVDVFKLKRDVWFSDRCQEEDPYHSNSIAFADLKAVEQ